MAKSVWSNEKIVMRKVVPYKGGLVVYLDGEPYCGDYRAMETVKGKIVKVRISGDMAFVKTRHRWVLVDYDYT